MVGAVPPVDKVGVIVAVLVVVVVTAVVGVVVEIVFVVVGAATVEADVVAVLVVVVVTAVVGVVVVVIVMVPGLLVTIAVPLVVGAVVDDVPVTGVEVLVVTVADAPERRASSFALVMHVSPELSERQSCCVCTRLAKKSVMPFVALASHVVICEKTLSKKLASKACDAGVELAVVDAMVAKSM